MNTAVSKIDAFQDLRIEQIQLKDLLTFASRATADPVYSGVLPITCARVRSQMKNPFARADDVVLLTAIRNGRCIGYHGLLPWTLSDRGRQSRMFWLITFFVDAAYRGLGIGKMLAEALKKLGYDLAVTGMSTDSDRVYAKTGFRKLGHLSYAQIDISRWLSNRSPTSGTATRFGYRLAKKCFYLLAARIPRQHSPAFTFRRIEKIDPFCAGEAENQPPFPHFHRGAAVVNWMIRYPWVLSREHKTMPSNNYHFSDVRDLFDYILVEVRIKNRKAPGFVLFSLTRKKGITVLKILDNCDIRSAGNGIIGKIALKYAAAFDVDRIEMHADDATFFTRHLVFKCLIKYKKRPYLYYPKDAASPLRQLEDKIRFHFSDSDMGLT